MIRWTSITASTGFGLFSPAVTLAHEGAVHAHLGDGAVVFLLPLVGVVAVAAAAVFVRATARAKDKGAATRRGHARAGRSTR